MSVLLAVDGDSFAHRAYHGLPKTVRLNAVVGFTNMMMRLWQSERPDAVLLQAEHVCPLLPEPLRRARRQGGAQFVEWPRLPAPAGSSSCTVELADGSGATVTIRWPGAAAGELLGLAEAFWRRQR